MITPRKAWLRLIMEEPLDPKLPICDAHHHLWEHSGDRYLVDELLQDTTTGHNIVSTVFMECEWMYRKSGPVEMQPVGETEAVAGVSGKYGGTDVALGIVGYADLTLGAAVAPILEAHLVVGKGRFRGVRLPAAWDASPQIASPRIKRKDLILDAKIREGVACLKKYGLSLDVWLFHTQLGDFLDLVKAFPEITIILNHIGCPLGVDQYAGKRDEIFREWKKGMAAVAKFPNVFLKVGGFGMPRIGFGFHERSLPPVSRVIAEEISPYVLYCIEQFGVDRCMFESNFPVDKVSFSYPILWNAFKRITQGFSAGEREALFHDTAVKAYRLSDTR